MILIFSPSRMAAIEERLMASFDEEDEEEEEEESQWFNNTRDEDQIIGSKLSQVSFM